MIATLGTRSNVRRSIMLRVDRKSFGKLLTFFQIGGRDRRKPNGSDLYAFDYRHEDLFVGLIRVYELLDELSISADAFTSVHPRRRRHVLRALRRGMPSSWSGRSRA